MVPSKKVLNMERVSNCLPMETYTKVSGQRAWCMALEPLPIFQETNTLVNSLKERDKEEVFSVSHIVETPTMEIGLMIKWMGMDT